MIVKHHQLVPGMKRYVHKSRSVQAIKMREDFMAESGLGWLSGKCGDWLVLIDDEIWMAVEDRQFIRVYRPLESLSDICQDCGHEDAKS